MKDICILCDFDGTITEEDGLYKFIEAYASKGWEDIEQAWTRGEISSKECLLEEFKLVKNLSPELINNFTKNIKIDSYFSDFYRYIKDKNIDFIIVSDGIDYFINNILKNNGINELSIISNHGEFVNDSDFVITFPNTNTVCFKNSGTCKCQVLKNAKTHYKKIIYIGDGVSDYCVADKADFLFAKSRLIDYCKQNNIDHYTFSNFADIKSKLNNI